MNDPDDCFRSRPECDETRAERDALASEVARLRQALGQIAVDSLTLAHLPRCNWCGWQPSHGSGHGVGCPTTIARSALAAPVVVEEKPE